MIGHHIKEIWCFSLWMMNKLSLGFFDWLKESHLEFKKNLARNTVMYILFWAILSLLLGAVLMVIVLFLFESIIQTHGWIIFVSYSALSVSYLVWCGLSLAWEAYQKEQEMLVDRLRRSR